MNTKIRTYEPKSNHFLSPNPYLINHKLLNFIKNPYTLNPYQYTQNNPLNLINKTKTNPKNNPLDNVELNNYDTTIIQDDNKYNVPKNNDYNNQLINYKTTNNYHVTTT